MRKEARFMPLLSAISYQNQIISNLQGLPNNPSALVTTSLSFPHSLILFIFNYINKQLQYRSKLTQINLMHLFTHNFPFLLSFAAVVDGGYCRRHFHCRWEEEILPYRIWRKRRRKTM